MSGLAVTREGGARVPPQRGAKPVGVTCVAPVSRLKELPSSCGDICSAGVNVSSCLKEL